MKTKLLLSKALAHNFYWRHGSFYWGRHKQADKLKKSFNWSNWHAKSESKQVDQKLDQFPG